MEGIMNGFTISTVEKINPMIYAYTTPSYPLHDGWTKIGYTEKQSVEDRIKQQNHTNDIEWKLEWKKAAVFDDGSYERFTDREFHAYLKKKNIERKPNTEWFHISGEESKNISMSFVKTGDYCLPEVRLFRMSFVRNRTKR